MKIKRKWIVWALLIALLCYLFLTPTGAIRLTLLLWGFPKEAFILNLKDPYKTQIEDNQIMYSLADPPFPEETGTEFENWIVTRHGIFYTGSYGGWG